MNLKHLFVMGSLALTVHSAHAHFLWAEIREKPERHVAIELAEVPGDSVVAGVNGKSSLVKSVPGKLAYRLQGKDFVGQLTQSDRIAGAAMEYGFLERGGVAFKLNYFAKAVQSLEDASQKIKLPAELTAVANGDDLVVTVFFEGKPAPGADVTYHLPKAEEVKGKADAKGNFMVPGGAKQAVAVMARIEQQKNGVVEGKEYKLIRNYSTLVIGRYSDEAKGDQEAFNALKAASEGREKFPEKLLGFQMEIQADVDGKPVTGSFVFDLGAGVVAKLDGDEESKKWVEGQIRSLVMHRSAARFEDGDGSYKLTFTGSENALGKQIAVSDNSETKYRVKDNQILEVNRTAGSTRLVVAVLDSIATSTGKKLATEMTVSAFDTASGALKSSTLITDSFAQTDGVWLPTRRRVVSSQKDGALVRTIDFKAAKLVLK